MIALKHIIKHTLCFLLYYTGTLRLYLFLQRIPRKGQAVALYTHRVLDLNHAKTSAIDRLYVQSGQAISLKEFRRRIEFLKKFFRIVSSEEYLQFLNTEINGNFATISFDDGYRDNFDVVLPALRDYGILASFFFTYDAIDKGHLSWADQVYHMIAETTKESLNVGTDLKFTLDDTYSNSKGVAVTRINDHLRTLDERTRNQVLQEVSYNLAVPLSKTGQKLYLSWAEVESMAEDPLVEIGCHTFSHPDLTGLSCGESEWEIKACKEELERKLGKRVMGFSYPYGDYDDHVKHIVKEAGFRYAYATGKGTDEDIYALRRLNLGLRPFCVFAAEVTGILGLFRKKRSAMSKPKEVSVDSY